MLERESGHSGAPPSFEWESGHSGAPPSCIFFYSSPLLEWESSHSGAPPLNHYPPSLASFSFPAGSACRAAESTSDSDPKWSPYLSCSPPDAMEDTKLSTLSKFDAKREGPGRSPLIFSWRSLDPLLSGLLSLFLILEVVHLVTDLSLALLSLLFYWLCF